MGSDLGGGAIDLMK